MEVKQKPFYNSLKRYWRRRSYQRLDHNKAKTSRKKIKSVKFTTLRSTSRRFWRIKAVPKLRFKICSSAIHKLWSKFKNAYMQTMINFSGKMWYSDNRNVFGDQRNIYKVGQGSTVYSAQDEFENRLVYEISKAVLETRRLSSIII